MSDLWGTPPYIYNWLDQQFYFNVDLCALPGNRKHDNFINAESANSLEIDWSSLTGVKSCYMNPPYSDPAPWVKKAYEQSLKGLTVVCLLPADTSTVWFHDWVFGKCEVWLIRGRISFIHPTGAKSQAPKFGSLVAIYGANPVIKSVDRPPKPKENPSKSEGRPACL